MNLWTRLQWRPLSPATLPKLATGAPPWAVEGGVFAGAGGFDWDQPGYRFAPWAAPTAASAGPALACAAQCL